MINPMEVGSIRWTLKIQMIFLPQKSHDRTAQEEHGDTGALPSTVKKNNQITQE